MQTQYDYIILGAGLSGLTTALRMSRDPFFKSATIAIVDQDLNKGNDRTWCFWETAPDLYKEVVSYTWPSVLIKGYDMDQTIDISPYCYKKVESEAMYAFAKAKLSSYSNITLIEDKVIATDESDTQVTVNLKTQTLSAKHVLNSIYKPAIAFLGYRKICLLYTSPSPRDRG